jgi:DNA repair protein RadC
VGKRRRPMMIREIATVDRPREKLLARGGGALTDEELLAALLGSGCGDSGVLEVARRLMESVGVEGLSAATPARVQQVKGMGPARACQLAAAVELGRRIFEPREESPPLVTGPEAAFAHVRDLGVKKREHFVALYLNARNALIKLETISIGSLNTSLVHPREVFHPAVRELAANIILAHNHPSGDVTPSQEDIELTHRLTSAGELMGIEILDHLVVGGRRFTSLKSRGLM